MASKYSAQTQGILDDFMAIRERSPAINAALLAELRQMAAQGELDSPPRIKQAVVRLEDSVRDQNR